MHRPRAPAHHPHHQLPKPGGPWLQSNSPSKSHRNLANFRCKPSARHPPRSIDANATTVQPRLPPETYLRFVIAQRIPHMAARAGFFTAAYTMRRNCKLDSITAARLQSYLDYFRSNLAIPKLFTRSKSKSARHSETTPGLSWFKASAAEILAQAYDLAAFLTDNGYAIQALRSTRIGYIIHQAVAEPFASTST